MRCAYGEEKLQRERIRGWRLVDELQEPIQAEDGEHQPKKIAGDGGREFHDDLLRPLWAVTTHDDYATRVDSE